MRVIHYEDDGAHSARNQSLLGVGDLALLGDAEKVLPPIQGMKHSY